MRLRWHTACTARTHGRGGTMVDWFTERRGGKPERDRPSSFFLVEDVAKGHHFCDPSVIHSEIKRSNILLNVEFKANIGDFGIARLKTKNLVEGFEEEGASLTVIDSHMSLERCALSVLDFEMSLALSSETGLEKESVLS
ncbi:hypothetical protein V6N12_023685 [Hibiscus sabdariffa]|uniref:Protein kinase domain-containing protein n=1 Tax=Hibiscus sabdariffa TaxID=183260 RepID=A0ABR2FYS9_9ROSI